LSLSGNTTTGRLNTLSISAIEIPCFWHFFRLPPSQSSAGRKPKSSWHHLLPIVAAYMMTLDKRPGESRDHNAIAGMVLQLAREEDIKALPTIDTMKDVISKIFNRADEFSTQQ
jgi:hypothetical protein